jgi:hypothetical protein
VKRILVQSIVGNCVMITSNPLAPCHRYASLTMPRPRLGWVARTD